MKQKLFSFCSVPYLNAQPLTFGLKNLQYIAPSKMKIFLKQKKCNAALLPSFDYLKNQEIFEKIGNFGIICPQKAHSVNLIFNKNCQLKQIKKIFLHEDSSSSVKLLKILLIENGLKSVKFQKKKITHKEIILLKNELRKFPENAVLLIGNPCLEFKKADAKNDFYYYDLAEHWMKKTALPFVFACWVCLKNNPKKTKMAEILKKSAQKGIKNIDKICSKQKILSPQNCKNYLTKNIYYKIGEQEEKSLALFARKCEKYKF